MLRLYIVFLIKKEFSKYYYFFPTPYKLHTGTMKDIIDCIVKHTKVALYALCKAENRNKK